MGFAMAQRTSLVASAVPADEIGIASSLLALVRNIAGAFGIAIFATLLQNSINGHLAQVAQHTVINNMLFYPQVVSLVILKSQMLAYSTVFKVSAFIVFVGSFLALLIKVKSESNIKVHVEA